MSVSKNKLRKKVLSFISAQPGHNQENQEKWWLTVENGSFIIMYRKDDIAEVLGFEKSVYLAYHDFVRNWKHMNRNETAFTKSL